MLAPAMATMLAVAHHRRRRRPPALHAALTRRGRRDVQRSCASTAARAPTTPCWCSRTARPGTRRSARRTLGSRCDRARSPRSACRSPVQMARDAEGATKLARIMVRGARSTRRGPPRGARGRRQPARAVLAERRRPVLGPGAVRARRERRGASTRSRSRSPTTASMVCRDGIARRRTTPTRSRQRHGRRASIEIVCDLHAGAERGDDAASPTSATPTSTRTCGTS